MIGLSGFNVGNIEVGRVNTTDRVLSAICEKYSINELWLRNGGNEESIFNTPDEDLEAAKYIQRLLINTDNSISELIKNFIIVYEKLDADSKKFFKNSRRYIGQNAQKAA